MKAIIHEYDISSAQKLEISQDDCWVMIKCHIGPDETVSTETFKNIHPQEQFIFYFATPKFLLRTVKNDEPQIGRGLIIIENYNETLVKNTIKKIIDDCSKDKKDWHDFATSLNRYAIWEFDDYKEYEGDQK